MKGLEELDGKTLYAKLLELFADQEGVEISYQFEGEDEIRYTHPPKNKGSEVAKRATGMSGPKRK